MICFCIPLWFCWVLSRTPNLPSPESPAHRIRWKSLGEELPGGPTKALAQRSDAGDGREITLLTPQKLRMQNDQ